MIKINKDLAIKGVGIVCTIAGMVLSNISTSKENAKTIEKAVEDHFKKQ